MSSDTPTPLISIVGIGIYRHIGMRLSPALASTRYRLTGFLDLTSEPDEFRYNTHNLSTVLRALNPRPQILITGAAMTPEMSAEAIEVFETYARDMGVVEKSLVINLSEICEDRSADSNWMEVIMGKLEEKYSPPAEK